MHIRSTFRSMCIRCAIDSHWVAFILASLETNLLPPASIDGVYTSMCHVALHHVNYTNRNTIWKWSFGVCTYFPVKYVCFCCRNTCKDGGGTGWETAEKREGQVSVCSMLHGIQLVLGFGYSTHRDKQFGLSSSPPRSDCHISTYFCDHVFNLEHATVRTGFSPLFLHTAANAHEHSNITCDRIWQTNHVALETNYLIHDEIAPKLIPSINIC